MIKTSRETPTKILNHLKEIFERKYKSIAHLKIIKENIKPESKILNFKVSIIDTKKQSEIYAHVSGNINLGIAKINDYIIQNFGMSADELELLLHLAETYSIEKLNNLYQDA